MYYLDILPSRYIESFIDNFKAITKLPPVLCAYRFKGCLRYIFDS